MARATTKLALIIEYEGTRYHGFQIQANVPTIQGEVEEALFRTTGERVRVAAASRTDVGVHAKGQVVAFRTGSGLAAETFVNALNYYSPEDIAVKAAFRVPEDFDVRRRALSREYRYTILNAPRRSPLQRRHTYLVTRPLDVAAMSRACQVLPGRHDFAPFAGPAESRPVSTVRTVYKAEIRKEGELVAFDMVANSFLPHQVRKTVGALVEVGLGRMEVEAFWEMARTKKRGVAGPSAPPHGLCLLKVNYGDAILGEVDENL